MNKMRRMRQAGDTIVEVTISIAILGLVIATSAVLINRNYKTITDSQEHTVALKLAQSQIESLKQFLAANPDAAPTLVGATAGFCIAGEDNATYYSASNPACLLGSDGAVTTEVPSFQVNTTFVPVSGVPNAYKVTSRVGWSTILGTQGNVTLNYRMYQ